MDGVGRVCIREFSKRTRPCARQISHLAGILQHQPSAHHSSPWNSESEADLLSSRGQFELREQRAAPSHDACSDTFWQVPERVSDRSSSLFVAQVHPHGYRIPERFQCREVGPSSGSERLKRSHTSSSVQFSTFGTDRSSVAALIRPHGLSAILSGRHDTVLSGTWRSHWKQTQRHTSLSMQWGGGARGKATTKEINGLNSEDEDTEVGEGEAEERRGTGGFDEMTVMKAADVLMAPPERPKRLG